MKKILRKANAVLSCVLALTLVLGFFSCIKVQAAGTVFTNGNGRITVKVTVKDRTSGKGVPGEEVTLKFIDFTGEVEEVLSNGWDAILDAVGEDENSIWRWNYTYTKTGTATTDESGVATFKLDSSVDWLWYYEVPGNENYTGAYNRVPYLPYGRLGIVIPGLLQRGLTVSVLPKDKTPVIVDPDNSGDNGGGGNGGNGGNGDNSGGNEDNNGGNGNNNGGNGGDGEETIIVNPGGGNPPSGGGNNNNNNNGTPTFPEESSWGEIVEPDMEEVEPEIIDVMDDADGQALGEAVSKDPQVVTYDGGSDKKEKKDNGTKLVAKADTTPASNTDDTQYTDLDGDDTARGNTDIPEDEAKEEKKETVNFVAKVDDTKKDDAPAVAPATTEVKEEVSNPITELATQASEGVSLKFWLLWIIIGVVLVGGGVTIYLKRRR